MENNENTYPYSTPEVRGMLSPVKNLIAMIENLPQEKLSTLFVKTRGFDIFQKEKSRAKDIIDKLAVPETRE